MAGGGGAGGGVEQALLGAFHAALTGGGTDVAALIDRADAECRDSAYLNYYAGVYYQRAGDWPAAEARFLRCLDVRPFFTPPYFALADAWMAAGGRSRWPETERILVRIFDERTTDPTSGSFVRRFCAVDQVRIAAILGPGYSAAGAPKKAQRVYEKVLEHVRREGAGGGDFRRPYTLAEGWKNASYALGNLVLTRDPARAMALFEAGVERGLAADAAAPPGGRELLADLDRRMAQAWVLASHYGDAAGAGAARWLEKFSVLFRDLAAPSAGPSGAPPRRAPGAPIRIGYLSPDFNKNAVGLFLTALTRHYDRSRFVVYLYNIQTAGDDEFTALFRGAPGVRWVDAAAMTDDALAARMVLPAAVGGDQLDVLVDLIVHGVGNRIGAVLGAAARKPSLLVVNYLGCPSSSYLPGVTHRIGDRIADPPERAARDYTERMVYLPRTFLCYTLFDGVPLPPIAPRGAEGVVRIGVFNKLAKQSPAWVATMLDVLKACPNAVICLKAAATATAGAGADSDDGLPGWRDVWGVRGAREAARASIRVLPFTERLDDYLDQFNDVDFCVDTSPYSGTTTTCSSLLMGVPTYTVYGGAAARHVSNVSASLIRATRAEAGEAGGGCCGAMVGSLAELRERVVKEIRRGAGWREGRERCRAAFLAAMEPGRFMREYEAAIGDLIAAEVLNAEGGQAGV